MNQMKNRTQYRLDFSHLWATVQVAEATRIGSSSRVDAEAGQRGFVVATQL